MTTIARAAATALASGALLLSPATAPASSSPSPRTSPRTSPRISPRLSQAAHDVTRRPAVALLAGSPAALRHVRRFWTPRRMRLARPLDDLLAVRGQVRAPAGGPARVAASRRGRPAAVPATRPAAVPATRPAPGRAWTAGGVVARTAGRVFFTYQGRPASCTGDAVTSANESTVLTAGHCVRLDGAWHRDWVFVPGYHDGQAPYGRWTAARTLTTPQWEARETLDYDVGAAVVAPLGGRTLTSVVGGQGIAFGQARGQGMFAFGYPADAPYDGTHLVYCDGTATDDTHRTHDVALSCDMTSGASGGPWFLAFDPRTGAGTQNSVNSFKYDAVPTMMFGPYFGADVKALYDKAQRTRSSAPLYQK